MTLTDEQRQKLYDQENRRRELEGMLKTHECSQCHAPLVLLCSPDTGDWYVACGQDRTHIGYTKAPSLTQRYLQGEPMPLHVIDRIEARRRQQMEEALSPEQQRALAPYHAIRALTQQQATAVLRTIWPKAPDVEILKAAILCKDYGLHPLMKHVYLVPFKSKKTQEVTWATLVGIAATRLISSRRGPVSYIDGPRLMGNKEQVRIFGEVDDSRLWAITIVQDEAGNRAIGYGNWPRGEEPYGTDKGNTKANMAFIRSERNALDRLRPGEMPSGLDVVDPSYLQPDRLDALPAAEPQPHVDEGTGEVTESPRDDNVPSIPPDDLPMKTLGDLFNACNNHFGLKKEDVYRLLNVRDSAEIASVQDAWATVKAHKLSMKEAE